VRWTANPPPKTPGEKAKKQKRPKTERELTREALYKRRKVARTRSIPPNTKYHSFEAKEYTEDEVASEARKTWDKVGDSWDGE
jgi:hypothetical protein